ncbi:MAG: amidohydrolase family protein [Bauldia sp.]|nr:amidohydrolase family protein [Bauldia sp.]
MIENDVIVVDAVAHGFDFRQEASGKPAGFWHELGHLGFSGRNPKNSQYVLEQQQFEREWTADDLIACFFDESQTDIAVYHHIRGMGRGTRAVDATETSPLKVGLEMREKAPGRVFIYANLVHQFDPPGMADEIDQLVEEHGISGIKLYPREWDVMTGTLGEFTFDQEKLVFPMVEHALKRGIKVIAIHKAMGSQIKAFGVADLEPAALAFPEMNFEIVHAGFAFLEDTLRVGTLPNIYLNLENTSGFAAAAPRRFADIMGQLLVKTLDSPGAENRIIWATGGPLVHPQLALESFWSFEMPEDMMEGFGYPPLTRVIKKKILGENLARMLGLDLNEMFAAIPDSDRRSERGREELQAPWATVRGATQ